MMTNEDPSPAAYQKSWDDVVEFYAQIYARRQWEHDAALLRLTRTIANSERATRFRAGTSHARLIISTTPYYGLKPADPFVILEVYSFEPKDDPAVCVRYYRSSGNEASMWYCRASSLLENVDVVLRHLWADSRGDDQHRASDGLPSTPLPEA